MDIAQIADVAELVCSCTVIDHQIAVHIGGPALAGHLGEWIASEIFDVELESSASAKAIDGRFRSRAGPSTSRYTERKALLGTAHSGVRRAARDAADWSRSARA